MLFACTVQGIDMPFCSHFHYYLPAVGKVLDRGEPLLLAEAMQYPKPSARLQGKCVGCIPVSSQPVVMQTLCECIQEGGEALRCWTLSQGRP